MFHHAEIIAVGSELLLGNVANTDAQYVSQKLAAVGVETWVYCLLAGWPWKKALLCSFAVNALSCGVGLLLL